MAKLGDRIDKFTLVRQLGAGGMGETWEAVRQSGHDFEQRVAIKLADPEVLATTDGLESFRREGALAASLRHPNIAAVLDIDDRGGYIVCELVDGADLRAVLRAAPGGRLDPVIAVHVLGQIARGLSHAHRRILRGRSSPVIHRDMSPGNVVIDYDGNVKIVDFGIAKAMVGGVDVKESLKGKLSYMAPEQAMGGRMDGRVDQYALGVIAYEVLTGVRPNDGAHEGETLSCILAGKRVPISQRAPALSPALARVVERMLALRPEQRFMSMDAVLDALSAFTPPLTTHRNLIPMVISARQPHTIVHENGRFVSRPVDIEPILAALHAAPVAVEGANPRVGGATAPSAPTPGQGAERSAWPDFAAARGVRPALDLAQQALLATLGATDPAGPSPREAFAREDARGRALPARDVLVPIAGLVQGPAQHGFVPAREALSPAASAREARVLSAREAAGSGLHARGLAAREGAAAGASPRDAFSSGMIARDAVRRSQDAPAGDAFSSAATAPASEPAARDAGAMGANAHDEARRVGVGSRDEARGSRDHARGSGSSSRDEARSSRDEARGSGSSSGGEARSSRDEAHGSGSSSRGEARSSGSSSRDEARSSRDEAHSSGSSSRDAARSSGSSSRGEARSSRDEPHSSGSSSRGEARSSRDEAHSSGSSSRDQARGAGSSSRGEARSSRDEARSSGSSSRDEAYSSRDRARSSRDEARSSRDEAHSSRDEARSSGSSSRDAARSPGSSSRDAARSPGSSSRDEAPSPGSSSRDEVRRPSSSGRAARASGSRSRAERASGSRTPAPREERAGASKPRDALAKTMVLRAGDPSVNADAGSARAVSASKPTRAPRSAMQRLFASRLFWQGLTGLGAALLVFVAWVGFSPEALSFLTTADPAPTADTGVTVHTVAPAAHVATPAPVNTPTTPSQTASSISAATDPQPGANAPSASDEPKRVPAAGPTAPPPSAADGAWGHAGVLQPTPADRAAQRRGMPRPAAAESTDQHLGAPQPTAAEDAAQNRAPPQSTAAENAAQNRAPLQPTAAEDDAVGPTTQRQTTGSAAAPLAVRAGSQTPASAPPQPTAAVPHGGLELQMKATDFSRDDDAPAAEPAAHGGAPNARVRVLPWGRVWVDQELQGEAAPMLELTLAAGRHVIAVGRETPLQSRVVDLKAGPPRLLAFDLTGR